MEAQQIQSLFFQKIKEKLPPHFSMVDEIASLLQLSNDSAYRRIRCEKQLSFEEIQKLCSHYKISMDQLLHLQTDTFLFNGKITNKSDFTYENWLETIILHLETIAKVKPNHMYYIAKEIPFFYYFLIPEIAAFKSFFFMKSILDYEDWKHAKFSVNDDYSHIHELGKRISDLFASIPSTEIWSIENITSTLHQIEFYRETGALKSDDDAIALFDHFEELANHLERQAECGFKLKAGQQTASAGPAYKMFINELIMGDNMQLIQVGNTRITYINHSIINFITTYDHAFNEYMMQTFENMAHKSTPISEVNQRDRLMFFNRLRAKIAAARKSAVH
ncbi:hypothetical protein [Daejeonella oryzae]|uniref:hypothetical protein n=1 Tax=Daejeonella oryzae TaxID=1122943 RepID=UPI000408E24E|nr:hypothetical protein [Daejeonella oryzae]